MFFVRHVYCYRIVTGHIGVNVRCIQWMFISVKKAISGMGGIYCGEEGAEVRLRMRRGGFRAAIGTGFRMAALGAVVWAALVVGAGEDADGWGGSLRETAGNAAVSVGEKLAGEGMLSLVREAYDRPRVALTFDDGPSAVYTEQLLDGLKERDVRASFFLLGKCLEGNEELVRRMHREGHLIGNHTFSHVRLDELADVRAREEIMRTNNAIYEITGEYPQYMRPPFGAWKKDLELSVEMIPVFWTVDTLDWKSKDTAAVLNRVRGKVEDGTIILMHDEYASTVEAALAIVDELKAEGYEFVTADRLVMP